MSEARDPTSPTPIVRRALCIEDDRGAAILIKRSLERRGYAVTLASSGKEGLERFAEAAWDVVLVDHRLPDIGGLEVLAAVTARAKVPATIMVTGNGSENVAVAALKQGAHDYVVKDTSETYLELLPEVVDRACRLVEERAEAHAVALERERLVAELTEALGKIKTLSGLIPICAACKSIRNDAGFWETIEAYLSEHTDVEMTHGICPKCVPRYFPGVLDE